MTWFDREDWATVEARNTRLLTSAVVFAARRHERAQKGHERMQDLKYIVREHRGHKWKSDGRLEGRLVIRL